MNGLLKVGILATGITCAVPSLVWSQVTVRNEKPQAVTVSLKGTVTDTQGEPIPGASVIVPGTKLTTVTANDGSFVLRVPRGEYTDVDVSFVGMKTAKVRVKSTADLGGIAIKMVDNTQLSEVVVTGKFTRAKESYTGAVSTITEEEIKLNRGQNMLQTLKNIDASLNFKIDNLNGSNPNNLPSISIRGNASVPTNLKEFNETQKNTVNTPLIIMDGFEITLQKLMDYNDEEIRSINILKDAAATAIYGSRGANGVIVVVTKEPEVGKLRVSAEAGFAIQVPDLTSYDLLNSAEKLKLERSLGFYDSTKPDEAIAKAQLYNRYLKAVLGGVDTDWLSKPLHTGVGQRYNLRLEGGTNEFRWSASAQYNNVEGTMIDNYRNTFTGGITLLYRVKDFTFRNYTDVTINKSSESPYGSFNQYAAMNPYEAPYDANGNLIRSYRRYEDKAPYAGNPLYDATLGSFDTQNYQLLTNNFSVEWTPVAGLILRGQLGLSSQKNNSDKFISPFNSKYDADVYQSGEGFFRKGEYRYGSGDDYSVNANITASYARTFAEKHQFYIGVDWSLAQNRSKMYYFDLEGFSSDNVSDVTSAQRYATNATPWGYNDIYRRVGFTANVNYTYNNRYYLDASARVDGNSNFGSNKKYAPFWSVGMGWNIHNEKFMEGIHDVLSMLRYKISYGQTGTQLGNSVGANSIYKYITDNRYLNWTGAQLQVLGNPNLTWQKTDEFNTGIEFGFWENRLKGSFDYYTKKTSNLLSFMDLPHSMGFPNYSANVGEVKNNGFEAMLSGYVIRNRRRQFNWMLSGQLMYNKNKITKLSDDIQAQNETYLAEGVEVANLMQVGRPQNAIYGVRSMGIDPSTGRELFINKDGGIVSTWSAKDIVFLGSSEPAYRGIISSLFSYKAWTLNFSFAYHWGGMLYNTTLRNRVEISKDDIWNTNVDQRVLADRWQNPGDVTFFKAIDNSITKGTSRYVMKDNVLELQNIALQYKWDGPTLRRILPLQSITFAVNANDLFYWSSVKQERGLNTPFARNIQGSIKLLF